MISKIIQLYSFILELIKIKKKLIKFIKINNPGFQKF